MPDALDIRLRLRGSAEIAFYRDLPGNLSDQSHPEWVRILNTDAAMFSVMGVRMAQGRPFDAEADEPGHACEIVISYSLWQSHYGGLPVVGNKLRLDDEPCVIDGVLPQSFDLPLEADVWHPLTFSLTARENARSVRSLYGLAHLNGGVNHSTFSSQLATVFSQLAREHPAEDAGFSAQRHAAARLAHAERARIPVHPVCAVGAVLLMACANVANLLLARSSARLREVAVRVSVGASRLMLIQQLLTESVALGLLSAMSGLGIAYVAVRVLRRLPNSHIPRPESITVDWRVVLFAMAAAAGTGILFGIAPALRISFTSVTGVLSQAGGRISESRRQQFIRKLLIAAETAAATILLSASILLLRSFSEVSKINPGFATDHLLAAYTSLPRARYGSDTNDVARFARSVLERLKSSPRIVDAAFTTDIPLQITPASGPVQIEGKPRPEREGDAPSVINTGISPSFRATLQIPLRSGRDLRADDDRDTAAAILVNETFAKSFFPQGDSVGKRVRYDPADPTAPWQQIVGVIGDTRQDGLEAAVQPQIFLPLARSISLFPGIIIRTSNNPASHLPDIERAVRSVDPDIPIFFPRTMEQVEARRLGARTFSTSLLTGFAFVALVLACGGIFAVIAYSVSQRTSEIGVRMACGASQSDIVAMIVRQGVTPACIGIAAGLIASFVLNRYLASLLFQVKPSDPSAYAATVLLLTASSVLAAWLPARRAALIHPWRALRHE